MQENICFVIWFNNGLLRFDNGAIFWTTSKAVAIAQLKSLNISSDNAEIRSFIYEEE
jgi:hypothetical protein